MRSTGRPACGETGLPPPNQRLPAPAPREVHSHLLEGLLLLGRQGRQPQLCGCALPVLHLHGVCPLVVGSRGSLRTSSGPPSRGPGNATAPAAHYDSTQPTEHHWGQTGCLPQDPRSGHALRQAGRHLGGPGPTWSSFRGQAAMASSGAIKTGGKQQEGPSPRGQPDSRTTVPRDPGWSRTPHSNCLAPKPPPLLIAPNVATHSSLLGGVPGTPEETMWGRASSLHTEPKAETMARVCSAPRGEARS